MAKTVVRDVITRNRRTKFLQVRLSAAEQRRLRRLAQKGGETVSEMIRRVFSLHGKQFTP